MIGSGRYVQSYAARVVHSHWLKAQAFSGMGG